MIVAIIHFRAFALSPLLDADTPNTIVKLDDSRQKVITEAIGTFFWVFAVIGAISQGSPLAAFAIGGTVVAVTYAGAHVSGAHYNPAVSIAAFNQFSGINAILYYLNDIFAAAGFSGMSNALQSVAIGAAPVTATVTTPSTRPAPIAAPSCARPWNISRVRASPRAR